MARVAPLIMYILNVFGEPLSMTSYIWRTYKQAMMSIRHVMSLLHIITANETILPCKRELLRWFTIQLHKQMKMKKIRPESKLFPKFIPETSLGGSPENFRITLTAKPSVNEKYSLNLSNNCPAILDQLIALPLPTMV